MPPTVTPRELVATARREVRALKRPKDVRRDLWTHVIDILVVIAGYLPEPYPSQRTIAAKLDLHRTTVTRRLAMAERLGLISRTDRPNPGGLMDGTNYHLLCLSEPLRAAITRTHFQDTLCTQTQISYSVGDHTASPLRGDTSGAGSADREGTVLPFNRPPDDDWSSPAIGEDPKAGFPVTEIRTDPAVYLARKFDRKWADLKRTHPEQRIIRASSRGQCVGNIRNMLNEQAMSPEHVEAYMDEFVVAVAAGEVIVKEGQHAWRCFYGWWGSTDVEDPAERKETALRASEAIARARELWAEQDRLKGLSGS